MASLAPAGSASAPAQKFQCAASLPVRARPSTGDAAARGRSACLYCCRKRRRGDAHGRPSVSACCSGARVVCCSLVQDGATGRRCGQCAEHRALGGVAEPRTPLLLLPLLPLDASPSGSVLCFTCIVPQRLQHAAVEPSAMSQGRAGHGPSLTALRPVAA